MTRRREGRARGFHEAPLVLFSGLAVAGGGLGAAHLVLSLPGWLPWIPQPGVITLIALCLLAGLVLSVGHLGRPFRGPLALKRLGKSPLSNEVLVAGLAAGAGLTGLLLPVGHPLAAPVYLAATVLSVLTIPALGTVYLLRGQLTWTRMTVAHPLVLGTGFGLMLLFETLSVGVRVRAEILILVFLLVDGFLIVKRAGAVNRALTEGVAAHPAIMEARGAAFILRVLLGVLLPAWFLMESQLGLSVSFLLVAIFLDRLLFYGLSVEASTEAGVKRVEEILSP